MIKDGFNGLTYQWRIFKNTPDIKWKNKLHEVLDGYKTYAYLPEMEEYSLYHYKHISRQEKQNNFIVNYENNSHWW
jgi:hypothetical protein